jgi:hypothetical protein
MALVLASITSAACVEASPPATEARSVEPAPVVSTSASRRAPVAASAASDSPVEAETARSGFWCARARPGFRCADFCLPSEAACRKQVDGDGDVCRRGGLTGCLWQPSAWCVRWTIPEWEPQQEHCSPSPEGCAPFREQALRDNRSRGAEAQAHVSACDETQR